VALTGSRTVTAARCAASPFRSDLKFGETIRRPAVRQAGGVEGRSDQAASFPDALATWVAIASIRPGDRQS
jgi:hypothetical protein